MVEVTQADRDAGDLYEFCATNELALAFAAHRQAGIAEGRRQMRGEAAGVVKAMRDEDSPDLDFRYIRDRISAIPIGDE